MASCHGNSKQSTETQCSPGVRGSGPHMQHYASECSDIYLENPTSPYLVCIYLVVEWACPSVRGGEAKREEVGGGGAGESRHRRLTRAAGTWSEDPLGAHKDSRGSGPGRSDFK